MNNSTNSNMTSSNTATGAKTGGRFSILGMVQVAIFGAIICLMAFTPFLGYIPLGSRS